MTPLLRVLGKSALAIGFFAASVWSARTGWADYWFRQETIRGTKKAIGLTPGQAAYYVRLALLEADEEPRLAREALQGALTLNPSDSRAWIELGLRYETEGDSRLAQECLLRAATENKQYLPRWTLANYYFRHNDLPRFWLWAKDSATTLSGDPMPFFRLCGRVIEDGNLIDRLEISRLDLRASYLDYLLNQNRIDLIAGPSRRLLQSPRQSDVGILMKACDRLLESKRVDEALDIWNGLVESHRLPFTRLSPDSRSILTNGSFAIAPTSQGFDWRLPELDGVSTSSEAASGGLRIVFSGRQREQCDALVQFVPVEAHTAYNLRSRFRTSGIHPGSGLHWNISEVNGQSLMKGQSLSSDIETEGSLAFTTPAACYIVRLSLTYERAPGTTRIDGFIVLPQVDLVRLP